MMLLPYSFFLFSCPPLPMQLATFSRPIDTTEGALWKLLLDKIERPEEGVWARRMKHARSDRLLRRVT
jgi:hypothetical protein